MPKKPQGNWAAENFIVWLLFASLDSFKQRIMLATHGSGEISVWLLGEIIAAILSVIGIFLGLNQNGKWIPKIVIKDRKLKAIARHSPVVGIGILILINFLSPSMEENSPIVTTQHNTPKLNLEVLVSSSNNNTFSIIELTNNEHVMASNILMTINPSSNIINYYPEYRIDPLDLHKNGEQSLTAKMERMSACSKMFIFMITSNPPTIENIDVHVTYDNMELPLDYSTKINGTHFIPLNPNGTASISEIGCQ